MSQHIYLTGYRGTGKTSVARLIASQLDVPWLDLDDEIEARAKRTIAEIFADGGESLFRDIETDALLAIPADPKFVVALGGGAILRSENREQIKATGICIWLDADAEILVKRIVGDVSTDQRRPSLTNLPSDQEVRALLEQRRPLYQQVSDTRIDTSDKSLDAVAAEVLLFCEHSSL